MRFELKLRNRRSTSHLRAVIDLVIARPLVHAEMVAKELHITSRAATNLLLELGLREVTGRGSNRAWAIISCRQIRS